MQKPTKSSQELVMDLANAMKALRISRRITQEELSDKAGISLRALANLERNGGATVQTLVKALNALGEAKVISQLVPQPQISPLALLRHGALRPQRVRRSTKVP